MKELAKDLNRLYLEYPAGTVTNEMKAEYLRFLLRQPDPHAVLKRLRFTRSVPYKPTMPDFIEAARDELLSKYKDGGDAWQDVLQAARSGQRGFDKLENRTQQALNRVADWYTFCRDNPNMYRRAFMEEYTKLLNREIECLLIG